jgi:hypothetical protein
MEYKNKLTTVRIHASSYTKHPVLGSYCSGHLRKIRLFFRAFDFLLSSSYRFDIPKHKTGILPFRKFLPTYVIIVKQ